MTAPAFHVRDLATWKGVVNLWVRDAGTWKKTLKAHVRDAGTWKLFYDLLTVSCVPINCTDTDVRLDPTNASALVDLTANRSVTWSFVKVSGVIASLGPTSGTTTFVAISRTSIGSNTAVYDVTANDGIQSVITQVTVTATVAAP